MSELHDSIEVTFHGVRGSHTVFGREFQAYGGKTTCCEVCAGDHRLIIDSGTGIIGIGDEMVGQHLRTRKAISTTMLFTHTHLDHIAGIPFFKPVYFRTTELNIFGPKTAAGTIEDVIRTLLIAPFHPVPMDKMPMHYTCTDLVGGETIRFKPGAPHPEVMKRPRKSSPEDLMVRVEFNPNHPTMGVLHYRIEYKNKSFVFATDIEATPDGEPKLEAFAQGADLLAMDGMYVEDDMKTKTGWGHSTWQSACMTARNAQVKRLALIHHDPYRTDKQIRAIEKQAVKVFPETFAAADGQVVRV